MSRLLPLFALGLLSACATAPGNDMRDDGIAYEVTRRLPELTKSQPFAEGAVHVVAPRSYGMQTFTLVPCRGGAICAETTGGRAGTVTRGEKFYQVAGTYPGATFHLSPGGDGYMVESGRYIPIAWD